MMVTMMVAHLRRLSGGLSPLSLGVGFLFGFAFAYIIFTLESEMGSGRLSPLSFFKRLERDQCDYEDESWLNSENISNFKGAKLHGKGVISKVHGGVGNQLYLYACMYALARDQNRTLYNFIEEQSSRQHRGFLPNEREYALDKFQIPLDNLIDSRTRIDESSVTYMNDSQLLFKKFPRRRPFLQLDHESYCPSDAYWVNYKEDILTMFQLRPEVVQKFPLCVTRMGREIDKAEESVAVHVRKGDYTGSESAAWELPISYQKESILQISGILHERERKKAASATTPPPVTVTSPKFFIFSDDIEYCKRELEELSKVYEIVFVSSSSTSERRATSLEDFFLMSKCKHFIIPNSTFSWWAAYLSTQRRSGSNSSSDGGIVIASEHKPAYWKRERYKDKEKLDFYKNVLHAQYRFPKGWLIHFPLDYETGSSWFWG